MRWQYDDELHEAMQISTILHGKAVFFVEIGVCPDMAGLEAHEEILNICTSWKVSGIPKKSKKHLCVRCWCSALIINAWSE